MSPVDPSKLDEIRAAAQKRFGEQTMHKGSQMPKVTQIPFDSIELNLATFGGAPMGRMLQLWGGPSAGKTLSAWGIARNAQKLGMTVVYYNIEGTYDPLWVDELGVDTAAVEVVDCNIIEDIGRHLDVLLPAAHIHIVDSTSFAESKMLADASKDDSRPGADARAWKKVLIEAEQMMDKGAEDRPAENMIILISHETIDFKTGAAKPVAGKAIGHASSMTLRFRLGKKLYRTSPGAKLTDTRPKEGNDPLTGGHRYNGAEIEIECVKNKVGRPFGRARRILDYDTLTFDNAFEMLKAGLFLGVIEKSGSYYKFAGAEKSIQGEDKAKAALIGDAVIVNTILEAAERYCQSQGRSR